MHLGVAEAALRGAAVVGAEVGAVFRGIGVATLPVGNHLAVGSSAEVGGAAAAVTVVVVVILGVHADLACGALGAMGFSTDLLLQYGSLLKILKIS